ncbi:Cdc25 phosphatase Ibp1 [Vermiconidia calcicola]|uniref:Cdc25 phosphatase Ibp1 n=1 Tax=Vermiconidia calcicola TaxID=1690605 RepID=A0ACC3MS62_9PEZI|nr:Cdc25 phosphatase Ibp1 [Vermiconidia calcicola]
MASYTISDLKFITHEELASDLRAQKPGITVIDVRGDDYIGGHIKGCQNVPVSTFDYRMPELVRTLRDQDTVVFHCGLSQQRGPRSALEYLRVRDKIAKKGEVEARKDGADLKEVQKVVVLEGGFSKWQESYGEDKELTESYQKDLWE